MFLAGADRFEGLTAQRLVKRGEPVFRAGDRFTSLYLVHAGFVKSTVETLGGRKQVTAFSMPGEVLGLDGIASGQHRFHAIALEDTVVRVLPYRTLQTAAGSAPTLNAHLQRTMSMEIVRDHELMLLLGSMRAEERLATFLLNLSQRFRARGYAHDDFVLRMTRAEIGSFLGLKLETVSRAFSYFVRNRLIEVQQKHVHILSAAGLRQIATGAQG